MRSDCPKNKLNKHLGHDLQWVIKYRSDGKKQLRKQCTHCTKMTSQSFPFSSVKDINAIPECIDDVSWSYYREETEAAAKKKKEAWDYEYAQYRKTSTWKKKRELVLARDNKLCQSCLSFKATEVHHLTYIRLFNEPLFDLVSVCRNCHEAIHNHRPRGFAPLDYEIKHTDWYLKHCKK